MIKKENNYINIKNSQPWLILVLLSFNKHNNIS
jgi:hypothetical protein